MELVDSFIGKWLATAITLVVFGGILWGAKWVLFKRNSQKSHENMFSRQFAMLLIMLMSVVALVISLPIGESTEKEVLSLIGLVLSGLLAFSSTTIVSNLVAGAMMRFTEPFKTGDYIRVQEYVGRVTERGLFDCEIQTENRELIAVPNNLMINHAVTVVRSSGTIISASLSLGYDVHHSRISALLQQAASEVGLQDPYVHVTELGNFAVTYKISGLLLEVKNLLTTRSKLYCQVLDTLHENGIEIMSPSFMNQRRVPDEQLIIAKTPRKVAAQEQTVAEDIVFDKAEEAQQAEQQKQALATKLDKIKEQIAAAEGEQKTKLEQQLVKLEAKIQAHNNLTKQQKKTS